MPRVLVLDGMWNKSLAVVRSLGKKNILTTAGERTRLATTLFSKYCSRKVVYPSPLYGPAEFLSAILKEVKTYSYDILIPTELNTQLLLTQRENKKKLEQFIRIPFADSDLAAKINDKSFLMQYASKLNIDVPQTYFIKTEEELEIIDSNIEYPVLIKPRISSGSRGIELAQNKNELISSYIKVHKKYPFPIIQEKIPSETGVFGTGLLFNFDSKLRAFFAYKRLRTYPVSGGPSTLRESVKRDNLKEIAEHLLTSLNWIGIAHAEFIIDRRDGKPKLLEVNPRFWGSLQLAIESGVDFPFLLYQLALNGDIDPVINYKSGVISRWLIPGDIMHFLMNPKRFQMNPSFFDFSSTDDIFSLKDPMPVIGRVSSFFALFYDKEMRKLIFR